MPSRRRRAVLIVSAAALGVFLIVLAVASPRVEEAPGETRDGGVAAPPGERAFPVTPGLIPPEELFLPDQPDFAPGVLLGRERRDGWTIDDVGQWWANPLAEGEELWRSRIEAMVEEIMEGVP